RPGRSSRAAAARWSASSARSASHIREKLPIRSSFFSFGGSVLSLRRLASIIFAQQPFEGVEAAGPEALIVAQPLIGAGQGAGLTPADMRPALDLAANQAGFFQYLHMLGSAGETHGERLG